MRRSKINDMDYLKERELNLRDMNLEHWKDEIYLFQGVPVNMAKCGCTHLQMYRHIADQLVMTIRDLKGTIRDIEYDSFGEDRPSGSDDNGFDLGMD